LRAPVVRPAVALPQRDILVAPVSHAGLAAPRSPGHSSGTARFPSPPIVSSVGVPRLQPGPGVGASLPTACQFRRREVPDSAPGYKPPPHLGAGPRLAATTVPLDPREWVSRLSHRSPRRNALG